MNDTPRTTDAYKQRDGESHMAFEIRRAQTMEAMERELSAALKSAETAKAYKRTLKDENGRLREQRDRLADALRRCQDNAAAIQKLIFGYDGDCGAGKIAEEIEDDCQSTLAAVLKSTDSTQ